MATMNIAGLTPVNDPAYRYKMPRITGKVEGRGNGIKTVLTNITDVADSLKRDAPEITKFFGCELGAQTTYATDTDRAIVNGAHRDNDLQNHLSKYIENFVLCKNCRLPETHYKIKDGMISQKCLACGSKDAVDMTHKLTTFILAQHKRNKEAKKAAEKDGKKEAKKEKKEKGEKESKGSSKDAATDEGDNTTPVEKKSKSSKSKSSGEGDEAPETVFTNLSAMSAGAVDEESESNVVDDCVQRFKSYLANHPAATVKEQVEELKHLQTMASLRPADRCIIFLGAVFSDQAIAQNEVEKHHDMLTALAASEIQQRHLLAATEWFCGALFPTLTRLFPKLLMQLYDAEVVEEDTFLAWAADTTRNEFTADPSLISFETLEALHAAAAPFIKWLQEAEEEGEEGDEDEEVEEGEGEEDDENSK